MGKAALSLLLVLTVCGCSSLSSSSRPQPHAYINDVAVKIQEDSGYKLVAIDGQPPTRATSHVATVVPYAVVLPGRHTLTAEKDVPPGENGKKILLSATLEPDTCYRFAIQDGQLTLVKDFE